jgi:hypothetical protein
MKRYGWYASLGIVATGALGGSTACTVTSTSSTGDDSGIAYLNEAGNDTGANLPGDASTTLDAPDAASCGALSLGSVACDMCTAAHCCTEVRTCDTPDDAGTDDAGNTSCEQLLACSIDLAQGDGGTLDAGFFSCVGGEGGTNYTPSQQATTSALIDCVNTNCSSVCQ